MTVTDVIVSSKATPTCECKDKIMEETGPLNSSLADNPIQPINSFPRLLSGDVMCGCLERQMKD